MNDESNAIQKREAYEQPHLKKYGNMQTLTNNNAGSGGKGDAPFGKDDHA